MGPYRLREPDCCIAQLCYAQIVNEVVFSEEAVRLFRRLPKEDRTLVKDGIRKHLVEGDPLRASRNKFRLRRPSPYAEFELRLDRWRVFYRVLGQRVEVVLIGEKRGNVLLIGSEEFHL